jgi:preprotein translocase SecE subunit
MSRMVTLGLFTLMVIFGSFSLYFYIPIESAEHPGVFTFWGKALLTIPFFDVSFRVGFLISLVVFVGSVYLINRFVLNRASSADFLIDTEYEVRKVSWPSRNEYWGSSVAVLVSVVIIGTFIFLIDQVLANITKYLYTS